MDALLTVLGGIAVLAVLAIPALILWNVALAVFGRGVRSIKEAKSELDASRKCVVCGAPGTMDVVLRTGSRYVLCDRMDCANSPRLAPARQLEVERIDKKTGQSGATPDLPAGLLDVEAAEARVSDNRAGERRPSTPFVARDPDLERARTRFERDPQNPNAVASLARHLSALSQHDEAAQLWDLLKARGLKSLADGEWMEAANHFRHAAAAGDAAAMLGFGQALANQGALPEARHWLKKAAKAGQLAASTLLGELEETPEAPAFGIEDVSPGRPSDHLSDKGEVPNMAICIDCSTPLPSGSRFCGQCGSPVQNPGVGTAAEPPKIQVPIEASAQHAADVLDDPRVIQALGGTVLDDSGAAGLRVLLDPENAVGRGSEPNLGEIIAEFSQLGGIDYEWDYAVFELVEAMYRRTEGPGAFGFDFIRETQGFGPDAYIVYRALPGSGGQVIASIGQITELSTEDGLSGAAKKAGWLVEMHDDLKSTTDRLSPLLDPDEGWPLETDAPDSPPTGS